MGSSKWRGKGTIARSGMNRSPRTRTNLEVMAACCYAGRVGRTG